jgi:hypothetical protein
MSQLKTAHADAAIKGAALGILTFAAAKYNISTELVALALPFVAAAISVVSTKIGPANTTLLLKVAEQAIAAAPAKAEAPAPVKAAAKKAAPKKK